MIDTSLPTQVELLCLTHRAPLLLQGTLDDIPTESDSWSFISDSIIPMSVDGFRAIVNFKDVSLPMITLKINSHSGSKLTLKPTQVHQREQRLFPRLFGLINLSFKPKASTTEIEQWLGGTLSKDDSWITPTPLMNFSVNGAAFTSPVPVAERSTLLIQLNFETEIRGIGRVVRCAEEDEQYAVAVYFENIPEKGIQYLMNLTLQIQDSLF